MIELVLSPREIAPRDWATLLFVLSMFLIALAKTNFETRFNDFLKILISDKYIKVYKDSAHMMSGFTIMLFIVQLLSYSFFIQLVLDHFEIVSKYDWVMFIRIITFFTVLILSKFLIEKIIGTLFDLEDLVEYINLQKVSYRTFIAILLLPFTIYFFYNKPTDFLLYSIIGILLSLNMLTYIVSLRNYQNFASGRLFYFILYLCALEIAPYYFIYYLITKI
jgi:hypothetical protein